MIQLEDAGFRYGQSGFLRKLNLAVAEGGFCVLLGPAGAGKTTVMRLCTGELDPVTGHVFHAGRAVSASDRAASAELRRKYGILPQACDFIEHLTVWQNVALALQVSGVDPSARVQDINALLEWVGLAGRRDALPVELTAAERKHAGLARAVIRDPDIIVADDPCGGLDQEAAYELLALLVELNRMGKAVLMTSQDHDIARGAARVVPVVQLLLTRDGLQPLEER